MNGVKNMSNTLMATPRKFSMQQVFELLLRKPSNRQIIGYLTDLKTSGLENTMEMTYPTGGRGITKCSLCTVMCIE